MKLWVWRHFHLKLPDDWEMLQFSREFDAGRCAFADRYAFRLEMSWRVVASPPDFKRMMSDYESQLKERNPDAQTETMRFKEWRGLSVTSDGETTTRYGAYFADESCLIEMVFVWPEDADEKMAKAVLRSVGCARARKSGHRRWRAFGMDILAPEALTAMTVRADPAHASLSFGNEEQQTEEHFTRRGMVEEWLTTSVSDWLQARVPEGTATQVRPVKNRQGHRCESVAFEEKLPGLRGLLGRRQHRVSAAWICPEDGRLYTATRIAPGVADMESEAFPDGRFSCCKAMELEAR